MKYYIVDAFADDIFKGNQAGVCVLDKPIASSLMQNIAAENNLAETAFVLKREDGYDLKWFTPKAEIDLCGHATLGTAYVLSEFYDKENKEFKFHTLSGLLKVEKRENLFYLDFPSRKPQAVELTPAMKAMVDVPVLEAYSSRDLILVVESEEQVKNLNPSFDAMLGLEGLFALTVTAKGQSVDFVSRFFAPGLGVPEDPVTGSSHSSLIPFWAERLNKNEMVAKQLSPRGGTLHCKAMGERVSIAGTAQLYLIGELMISAE